MKWVRLKQVFSKRKLKSIDAIEYIKDRYLIRISNKLEIETEIIKENESRFKLDYDSLIFKRSIINKIG